MCQHFNEEGEDLKRICIRITDEEKERLSDIAAERDATPGELLAAFVADITSSARSGGSDERMYADQWLCRQTCRWIDGRMV